jgi:glycosyltransferase involved in cell wall biosynthesis
MKKISVIIPCYYNEANIPITWQKLQDNEGAGEAGEAAWEYVFVDDGSGDLTYQVLLALKQQYPDKIKLIRLSRNFGSYNAIAAGMQYAGGDCQVILAADLQDPPALIHEMYRHWKMGYPLVIGNRTDREDPWMSKFLAKTFHHLMRSFAVPNAPQGGFDFVLFDAKVRDKFVGLNEINTNLFYLMVHLGFPYVTIPYTRKKREHGVSRWTLGKRLKLFVDSFVSFSFFPVRLISFTGITLGMLAFLYSIFVLIARLSGLIEVEGYTTIMITVLLIGAFQMIGLGVLGEYLWRTLDAVRKRPPYLVESVH